jgi:hypothetical protein
LRRSKRKKVQPSKRGKKEFEMEGGPDTAQIGQTGEVRVVASWKPSNNRRKRRIALSVMKMYRYFAMTFKIAGKYYLCLVTPVDKNVPPISPKGHRLRRNHPTSGSESQLTW